MKRICFILGILVLFVFFAGSVLAKEIWVIEDEGLVCYIKGENYPIYPIPPEGLPVEIAGKLIRGEISEYIIEGDKEIKYALKPFRLLRKIEIVPRTKVFYADRWISKEILPQKREKPDWFFIVLFLIIPATGVLTTSIANQDSQIRNRNRKLFTFYGTFFVLIVFSALIGSFAGELIGGVVGMIIGLFVGVSAGGFAGKATGIFAGGFAGTFIGMFVGVLVGHLVVEYLIFFAFVCFFSFIAAKVIKKLWPVKKAIVH